MNIPAYAVERALEELGVAFDVVADLERDQ